MSFFNFALFLIVWKVGYAQWLKIGGAQKEWGKAVLPLVCSCSNVEHAIAKRRTYLTGYSVPYSNTISVSNCNWCLCNRASLIHQRKTQHRPSFSRHNGAAVQFPSPSTWRRPSDTEERDRSPTHGQCWTSKPSEHAHTHTRVWQPLSRWV